LSAFTPIKWLPDALPGEVEAALRDTLDRWARDWGAPAAAGLSARVLAAHEVPGPSASPWDAMPKAWSGALGRALLGPAATGSPVAQRALEDATADLQALLRQRFQPQPSEPFTPAAVGHGGIEVGFELLGQRFGFVLDIAALQAGGWLTATPRPRLAAVAFEQALHGLPVPLTARLGHASVSVTDLLQLRPGDIVLLAETLDAPLQVTSPGSPLLLTAHLGASADRAAPDRRAMRWLASS
jgi:flagellar motor switch/type III secretory pathway protein FliN